MRHSRLAVALAMSTAFATVAESQHPDALAAADELVVAMSIGPTIQQGMVTMFDAQVKQNPALAPYRGVMLEWAAKYMNAEVMRPEFAKIYAEAFSEPELRELTRFYRSEVGRKFVAHQPELMRRAAAVGEGIAKAHQGELEAMVQAHAEKSAAIDSARPPASAPDVDVTDSTSMERSP